MKISVYVVGSNPLPVLMALCYDFGLINENSQNEEPSSRIMFVYSKETVSYRDNMVEWLENKNINFDRDDVRIDNVHNAEEISQKVEATLNKIIKENNVDSIYLNHTGGTKVMAVNTAMAVIKLAQDSGRNMSLVEVDIDPEDNQIYLYYPLDNNHAVAKLKELTLEASFGGLITLCDIIGLYNYKFVNKSKNGFSYRLGSKEDTIAAAQMILNKDSYDAFRNFMELFFRMRDVLKNNKINKESIFDIKNNSISENTLENLLRFLECDKQALKRDFNSQQSLAHDFFSYFKERFGDKAKEFIDKLVECKILEQLEGGKICVIRDQLKFITGMWIEEYITAALEDIIGENKKNQYQIINNFEIAPKSSDAEKNQFEIDVVLRDGYTVYFISCTTDSKQTLCNKKVLEVLTNSESIGLRTQVILVSLSEIAASERFRMFPAIYYKKLKFIAYEDLMCFDSLKSKLREILVK